MFAALKTRDYRLLWVGQSISHLGDQFHLIALPWLVLTLTHDPLQLGFVLALAGIPRASLMLIGGAFADRHSPRTIMLVSDVLRFVLTGALAFIVLTGTVQIWMVYALALAFGVVSGFFMPAAEASLPRLLQSDELEGGNALMMGADQLAQFVGPALAGTLIALFGASHPAGRQPGEPYGRGRGVRGRRALVCGLGGDARVHAIVAGARCRGRTPSPRRRCRGPEVHDVATGLSLDVRAHRGGEPSARRSAARGHSRAGPDALRRGSRRVRLFAVCLRGR